MNTPICDKASWNTRNDYDEPDRMVVNLEVAQKLERKMLIAVKALQEIANEDFRGNRPASAHKAYGALKRMEEVQ